MKKVLLSLVLVLALASFLGLLGALSALLHFAAKEEAPVLGERVLTWHLSGPLEEEAPDTSWLRDDEDDLTMAEVYTALRAAPDDDDVRALAIYIEEPRFGLAKAQEVRRLVERFAATGKPVDCYLETAGEGSNGTLPYYLATACNRISLAPAGEVNLLGLYFDGLFLGNALDKLRVDPQFQAAGEYKSAIETYTRANYSAPAREALEALLDHGFEQVVTAISSRRGLEVTAVRQLIDEAPFSAEQAIAAKLVDELAYPDEFDERVARVEGRELSRQSLRHYAESLVPSGPRVAIVYANGVIVRGGGGGNPFSSEHSVGSDDMVKLLRELADDEELKAVVLRVDSPGGSALASDLILREVERLKGKKPVVASLSDVAASGGYYIVTQAPTIVAEASTITGSIGVYTGKLATGRLESELLGITHDTLKRGANADLYDSTSRFSPAQAQKVQDRVDDTYRLFRSQVERGRGLAPEAVERVARGRVWSGTAALEHHLVDRLGGLDLAIDLALQAAREEGAEVALEFHPQPRGLFDWLLSGGHQGMASEWRRLVALLRPPRGGLLELPTPWQHLEQPY